MIDNNPRNEDPISGEAGAHPVGTGVGAAGGAVAGATVGSVAGPIGTAIGAVVGAVVGGLAGKGAAEAVNPTIDDEETYWRGAYATRPGYQTGYSYEDDYAPAYRLGYEGRGRYQGAFDASERELAAEWERVKGKARLTWEQAKLAARDAWDRFADAVDETVGEHPVATGAGATGGALAGAAVGSVAGPVGAAVGAAIGAAAGGLAGKGAGEVVNPKAADDRSDHNLATGVGAGAGAAAGAALGAVGGPVGMAVGAAVGAAAGGLAGKGAGQLVNPAAEDAYWRGAYANRPDYVRGYTYDDDYAPAYRLGYDARGRLKGAFDASERELAVEWERIKGKSRLTWEQAKTAARDAWHHIERALPGDADGDGR